MFFENVLHPQNPMKAYCICMVINSQWTEGYYIDENLSSSEHWILILNRGVQKLKTLCENYQMSVLLGTIHTLLIVQA